MPAGQPGVPGLSASAILAVAEGLRWTDPQLSVALAEHVARVAGADASARTAAERSAVLALGQSDRGAELIVRALPHLRAAEREGRIVDAGTLRCELSLAALRCGDVDAAEALLEPLAAGRVLPPAARADALVAWAAARATRGDVAGVDAAGRQVDDVVGETADDARRLAMRRARAEARRHAGDTSGALEVLRVAVSDANVADGGRQAALLLADRVELLAGLGRRDEAREAGTPALADTPRATTSLALGRLRCVLAQHVHLPAGEFETAERLAREAETDLTARGHEAQVAVAIEVLAAVAEGRGDVRQALEELRRARPHLEAAHEEATRARAALAAALSRDEDRIPSAAATGDSPDGATGEDADGAWATVATGGAGPAEIATDTPLHAGRRARPGVELDGLPASSGPEEPRSRRSRSPGARPSPTTRRSRPRNRPPRRAAAGTATARRATRATCSPPRWPLPAASSSPSRPRPPPPSRRRPTPSRPSRALPRPSPMALTSDDTRGDEPWRRRPRGRPAPAARPGSRAVGGAGVDPAPSRRPALVLPLRRPARTTPSAGGTTSTGRPVGAPTRTGSIPSRIVDTGTSAAGTASPDDSDPLGLERLTTGARDEDRERSGSRRRDALDDPDPRDRRRAPGCRPHRHERPGRPERPRYGQPEHPGSERSRPGRHHRAPAPGREVSTTSWRGSWRSRWSTSSASTRTPGCRSGAASRTARRRR